MKYLYMVSLLLILSAISGCASNKINSKTAQDLIAAHKAQGKYLDVMNKFMIATKKKDIKKMISLTSNTTISKNGIDSVKNLYKNKIIPEINSCKKIYTHKNVSLVNKKTVKIGSGYAYNKICLKENKETSIINIMILKEKERISLVSIFVITPNKPNKKIKDVR